MNRRRFLKGSVAGLAYALTGGRAFAAGQEKPRRVGLIGTGWYGKNDLFRLLQVSPVEVVSLCDPDRKMLEEAAEMVAVRQASKKKPRLHGDWRELLKEKDLDIVLIGTPDHWHALPMIEAVKAGADVYVQKPISLDVVEGQAMVAAARKYKRVVQVGTQRRSTLHLAQARDRFIREGKLGKISQRPGLGHCDHAQRFFRPAGEFAGTCQTQSGRGTLSSDAAERSRDRANHPAAGPGGGSALRD